MLSPDIIELNVKNITMPPLVLFIISMLFTRCGINSRMHDSFSTFFSVGGFVQEC